MSEQRGNTHDEGKNKKKLGAGDTRSSISINQPLLPGPGDFRGASPFKATFSGDPSKIAFPAANNIFVQIIVGNGAATRIIPTIGNLTPNPDGITFSWQGQVPGFPDPGGTDLNKPALLTFRVATRDSGTLEQSMPISQSV